MPNVVKWSRIGRPQKPFVTPIISLSTLVCDKSTLWAQCLSSKLISFVNLMEDSNIIYVFFDL
jgi:hypothetical protein